MVWSHNDQWMVTGDTGGFVKYWQTNMNNVKLFQAHKDPVRGLRYHSNFIYLCRFPSRLINSHLVFSVAVYTHSPLITVLVSHYFDSGLALTRSLFLPLSYIAHSCTCSISSILHSLCIPNLSSHRVKSFSSPNAPEFLVLSFFIFKIFFIRFFSVFILFILGYIKFLVFCFFLLYIFQEYEEPVYSYSTYPVRRSPRDITTF